MTEEESAPVEKFVDETDRVEKVLDGIDALGENGRSDTITLSTGIVFKLKPIPKQLIRTVTTQFKEPAVPVQYIEEKSRKEENPTAPSYIEAMEKYIVDIANATIDVCLLRGTEVIEIPNDIPDSESDQWKQEMELLGLPMINNPRARYLLWIKGIAAPLDRDINLLMEGIGRLTGVSEADVQEAVQRFRSLKESETDN